MIENKSYVVSMSTIALFLLYFITLVHLPYISKYSYIKYASIVFIGIFLIKHCRVFLKKKYIVVNAVLIAFCAMTMCSALINHAKVSRRDPVLAAIVFLLIVVEVFFMAEYAAEKRLINYVIKLYYKLTLIVITITDLLIVFRPSLVKIHQGTYFSGGKFTVMYLHIMLIALFYIKKDASKNNLMKNYAVLLFYSVLSIIISILVDCNTGLIGIFLFLFIVILLDRFPQFFLHPAVFMAVLLISCSFMFVYDSILSNGYVQHFVTDTMGRTMTLTGRVNIYATYPNVMKGHWTWGYGYGSSYEICKEYFGYADTQNGLGEWILTIGVIATVIMLILFFAAVQKVWSNRNTTNMMVPMIAFLYVLSLVASIEISIGYIFFSWIAFAYGKACENKSVETSQADLDWNLKVKLKWNSF